MAEQQPGPDELPAVAALETLSMFGANQSGAYREHFAQAADALGEDIATKLASHVKSWGADGAPGVLHPHGQRGHGKDRCCRDLVRGYRREPSRNG